jgi:hypothetical protein
MVRSGRSPLVQIVKRLDEMERFNACHVQAESSQFQFKTKSPNNAYILQHRTCCEFVAKTNNKDDEGKTMMLCRIYESPDSLFIEPCDSRLVGSFKASRRSSRMKLMPPDCLKKHVILIDEGENTSITFLAILHEV